MAIFGKCWLWRASRARLAPPLALLALLALFAQSAVAVDNPVAAAVAPWRAQIEALRAQGRAADAIALLRAELAQLQADLSATPLARADVLVALADALLSGPSNAEAAALARQAWALRREQLGERHADTLLALNVHLDAISGRPGLDAEQRQLVESAVAWNAQTSGDDSLPLAFALVNRARMHNVLGKPLAALDDIDRANAIRRVRLGPRAPELLEGLTSRAVLLGNAGRYKEALATIDEVVALHGEPTPANERVLMLLSQQRALALMNLGRIDDAIAASAKVLAAQSGARGAQSREAVLARSRHGRALLAGGQYTAALAELERAVNDAATVMGQDTQSAMVVAYQHALALQAAGLPLQARDRLRQLAARAEAALGTANPDTITYRGAYGDSLRRSGDPASAVAELSRAVAQSRAALPAGHQAIMSHEKNLALALLAMGDDAAAQAAARRAHTAAQAQFGELHPMTLAASRVLADAQAVHEPQQAIARLRQTAQDSATALGPNHPDTLQSHTSLGIALERSGQHAQAVEVLEPAAQRIDALREQTLALGPRAQGGALDRYAEGMQALVVAHAALGNTQRAFEVLDQNKARALLDQLARQRAIESAGLPAAQGLALQALAQRRAAVESRLAVEAQPEARDELQRELRLLHADWAVRFERLRAAHPMLGRVAGIEAVRAADARLLGPQTAFVSFMQRATGDVHALVLSEAGAPRWFALGRFEKLDETVEALRLWSASLGHRFATDERGRRLHIHRVGEGDARWWFATAAEAPCAATDGHAAAVTGAPMACVPAGAVEVRSVTEHAELARFLGQRLIEPLHAALEGKRRLLISPDGTLGLVPWDVLALHGARLIERFGVSQTPSLSVFKLLATQRLERQGSAAGNRRRALLAIGDARYDEAAPVDGDSAPPRRPWPALPFAGQEVREAVQRFKRRGAVAVTGREANETTLRRLSNSGELARYANVLIAAHGHFDRDRPERSGVMLTREGDEPERDGLVTAADWLGLRLRSDLVVLSACDTARGERVSGEGLVGLSYALLVAGNSETLATLWAVPDASTALFVNRFLGRLHGGLSAGESLAQTKREFAGHADERLRNPRVWAGFVLYGG